MSKMGGSGNPDEKLSFGLCCRAEFYLVVSGLLKSCRRIQLEVQHFKINFH